MENSSTNYITFYISQGEVEDFFYIHCFNNEVSNTDKEFVSYIYGLPTLMDKIQKKYDSYDTTVSFRIETPEEIEKLLTRYGRK